MSELKEFVFSLVEIFIILAIGLLFTIYILLPVYESFGISFMGNVWVNWFGVSYILYVLYSLIAGLFIFKGSVLFKQRFTLVVFWLVFIGANYVVFIPFFKGENPF
ncbi:hypothetical protein [Dethiobacter alkaliphilus]|uniref:hypothetical protein n=1 Tax=Dethiobacter alkaliphilus TaxID=427926 RepID=UPI002225E84A|nr:hypothetical protein [Dethiobacter alkaliphilus]MCW3491691.1 hypothetical protein [Dethiobacter alkaliphilus]